MSETGKHIPQEEIQSSIQLDGGTYEILRNRLNSQGKELRKRLEELNKDRKNTFGAIEHKLIATDRINTANNCIARDIVTIGNICLFGYNVHMGLKADVKLADVFSIYEFNEHRFHEQGLDSLHDQRFEEDFANLYKYYKHTVFAKFAVIGPHLFMIFQVGKSANDIKTFKWLIKDDGLQYLDNRSDHEFRYPTQHDFRWQRATRDDFREGKHPHVSILDRVFVETVGGDLTIKVEDNTDTGRGIYAEPVSVHDQTLDDAEYFYANLGNIIVLKIRPYQEKDYRYFAFNEKVQEVKRVDSIAESCVLLPDDHGIIFSDGYYLQTGEFKLFQNELEHMRFEKRVASPNGEDYLYVFYHPDGGDYILMSYNLIAQEVQTPIICNGYCLFEAGEMCYFRAEASPTKHHAIQIWQTSYTGPNYQPEIHSDSYLYKIGNKDIVRAMAECHEVLVLLGKEETYSDLYTDLVKKSGDILDSYYWLNDKDAHGLNDPLKEIRDTALSAIEEFEKVLRVRKATNDKVGTATAEAEDLLKKINRTLFEHIDEYVNALSSLRKSRGTIISLKELRYADVEAIETLEAKLVEQNEKTSQAAVEFLLKDNALKPYHTKVANEQSKIEKVTKVTEADELKDQLDQSAGELEMLIEVVSNLKIQDATQTTKIIEDISGIYSQYNQIRAVLRKHRRSLFSKEGKAEFNSQIKLIDQAVINYLDISETPEKVEEYLTKLMVQVEELEGKFSEFEEFITVLADKREEIYNAFESKKVNLVEARNKRANSILQAGDRILKGIHNRVGQMTEASDINGYFASDLMIEKIRDLIQQLFDLNDSVKAEDLQSRLKRSQEDALRQLKDKQELFVGGDNVIKFGEHHFGVNVQDLDLTIVPKGEEMYYHLTGTNFFEKISDKQFLETRSVWQQSLPSENEQVYRGEFLADLILRDLLEKDLQTLEEFGTKTKKEKLSYVQEFMVPRFNEGYAKGVHDHDGALILNALLQLHQTIGLLRYTPEARANAIIYWEAFAQEDKKEVLNHRLKGIGYILQVFPDNKEFGDLIQHLQDEIRGFNRELKLYPEALAEEAGEYLFNEISRADDYIISPQAEKIVKSFHEHLKRRKTHLIFDESISKLTEVPDGRFELIRNWIAAFAHQEKLPFPQEYVDEAAALTFAEKFNLKRIVSTDTKMEIKDLLGDHLLIEEGNYQLDYNDFTHRLREFRTTTLPRYQHFQKLKKELAGSFKDELRLDEFKPRVMSSFVRNRLIDEVYLPMIGDNLAKQIGVVGTKKRTDLMGMLLLISPPGYGKTTLMEYVASRLGVIFMKINGPAIGHHVVSLDPSEAPNAAAREELQKLNLAFEMGDNIMIYLDDIQHCNPEFLQKFISLCDAQRKVEGVYKGKTRTYDLRGKKVCVIMAGNPYTESGEKFRIPDMLANRADTYNLGDILGNTADLFNMSYIENCLTSNPVLAELAGKSQQDVRTLVRLAETDDKEGLEFEREYSADQLNAYLSVLKKLFVVRDVISRVNQEYIDSAAQSDEFRTEPAFKLQGSYRDMNKIAGKVMPVMNDDELQTLILSHYESEAQTLTTGAEANLLKFKEMNNMISDEDAQRWEEICKTYKKNQSVRNLGGDKFAQVVAKLGDFNVGLEEIRDALLRGRE